MLQGCRLVYIHFKIAFRTCKVKQTGQAEYLLECIQPYIRSRSLRFSEIYDQYLWFHCATISNSLLIQLSPSTLMNPVTYHLFTLAYCMRRRDYHPHMIQTKHGSHNPQPVSPHWLQQLMEDIQFKIERTR